MKRLAARAPHLGVFSQRLIERNTSGWSITVAGWSIIEALEGPCPPQLLSNALLSFPLAHGLSVIGLRNTRATAAKETWRDYLLRAAAEAQSHAILLRDLRGTNR